MPSLRESNELFNFNHILVGAFALQGCKEKLDNRSEGSTYTQHSESLNEPDQATRSRPTNQVAVLTVWADAERFEQTALFYKDILKLRFVASGDDQYILDTDGSFLVIMEGRLEQPQDTKRRWPLFALTVPNLEKSVSHLRQAGVELPWGIEEFGNPEPSSRYVMFYDPAGNLIEIVEWL